MACAAALLASILVALPPYCSSTTEVSNQTRWFVHAYGMGNSSRRDTHYDRQFGSLDLALTALSRKTAVRNVTLLLGRGEHTVSRAFYIDGADSVTISSEERDRNSVFLNVTDNGQIVFAAITFNNSANITLSYLTARLTLTGGMTLFLFTYCDHVIVDESSFVNSLSASSSLIFYNCEQVYISHSMFLFTVNLLEDRNQTASLSFGADRMFPWKETNSPSLTVSDCRFYPNKTVPFVGYGSIGKAHETLIEKSAVISISLMSRDLTVILQRCHVDGLVYAFAVPVAIVMQQGSINNTVMVSSVNISNSKCIVGCGILSAFTNGSFANTITITDSHFINNSAVVEGGAGFGYFDDSSHADQELRNSLHYRRCDFTSNKVVEYFGAGSAFMSLSTGDSTLANVMTTPESDLKTRVQFTDCKFVNNLATRGTVFSKNSVVTFDGFWSVQ